VADVRVPRSTYRLQLTRDLTLDAAAGLLDYLRDLGVDWVYLSPVLQAEPGSTHGYDVVAHDRVDAERGGPEGLARLSARARELGLGVLVDIVPNHVGVATPLHNAWWADLLRRGRGSAYASAFDVDWAFGDGRLRIPVVGDDDLRPDGRIAHLEVAGDTLRYHDHVFPLAAGSTDDGDDPDTVHRRQHYELVHWRRADEELNYRRFFAVSTLAAVRVEDPEVFAATHAEIRRWFDPGPSGQAGLVDGLRVDHPDGLRDPAGYLADLAGLTGSAYVLVEKILSPEVGGGQEELPPSWNTAGTTGYDALGMVDRVLVDPGGRAPLDALETRLRAGPVEWPRLVHDSKRAVADGILRSEVRRIVRELPDGLEARTSTSAGWEDAVAELLACFPVYRSYLPEGREHVEEAFAGARQERPDLGRELDALHPVLSDPEQAAALRFQQTSGMVMAKGVEDSAYYRWSRLTTLNEVGGDPAVFAVEVADFHAWCGHRQRAWPEAMTATSTHDTKRGEDVRARIAVLAELPDLGVETLDRLLALAPLPDPGFGNLLWQAVVGAWPPRTDPAWRDRLHGYAEKAMHEAGDRTTWTDPDAVYEKAVHAAVDGAFDDAPVRRLLTGLVERIAAPGWSNSQAVKAIALTMPGVPDVYQGSELEELSLVDPDNRRPVDFDRRRRLLADRPDLDDPGAAKLAVTRAGLHLRRDRPELFEAYAPLAAEGSAAGHLLAFDRGGVVTAATRLPVGLARRGWGDTVLRLPAGRYVEQVTGRPFAGAVRVDELLAVLPVALLAKEG
jgi:(1->4)-alpha-D-glucan 1-alpha-D-glucosylmutase